MSAAINTTVVNFPTPDPPTPAPTTPPARVRPPNLTTERAIEKFIEFRDKIAAIKKRHSQELLPYGTAQDTLEAWLLSDLEAAKVEAMRSKSGTVYKSVRTSAKVDEWGATLAFIIENEAWELLEARIAKLALEAMLEATGLPVPGVAISREVILNVRKPTGKG